MVFGDFLARTAPPPDGASGGYGTPGCGGLGPGAQAEPAKYTFSVPNTTIKVNNASQFVHVPFISTVVPSDIQYEFEFEFFGSPGWISSYDLMTFKVSANKAEDASERNAQVTYIYTDPKGVEHTGSFRIYQSATKNIE